jgi:hypothetical protein
MLTWKPRSTGYPEEVSVRVWPPQLSSLSYSVTRAPCLQAAHPASKPCVWAAAGGAAAEAAKSGGSSGRRQPMHREAGASRACSASFMRNSAIKRQAEPRAVPSCPPHKVDPPVEQPGRRQTANSAPHDSYTTVLHSGGVYAPSCEGNAPLRSAGYLNE